MKYTHEQDAIGEAASVLGAGEVLKVIAFAGAGKTTTLKAIATRRKDRGIYLAFNKAIADEAGAKLVNTRCASRTMHSLAYGAVVTGHGRREVLTVNRIRDTLRMGSFGFPRLPGWTEYRLASLVKKVFANYCASDVDQVMPEHAAKALLESLGDPATIRDRVRRERAEVALDRLAMPAMFAAQSLWDELRDARIYSDDAYLKMLDLDPDARAAAFRGFRYVLLDEAQDLNPVQRSIVTKTGLPLVAVGDPYQQIYSWRGAENALALLPGESLYLTQSFRFGEDIAAIARDVLSARPDGGPEQRLIGFERDKPITKWAGPAGAWICRTNMGVLETALDKSRKARHPIFIDNFGELLSDVNNARCLHSGKKMDNPSTLLASFQSFAELEAEAEGGDAELGRLVKIIEDNRDDDVRKLAEMMVKSENEARIIFITGHRSKGREWPTVGLGNDWKSIDEMTQIYEKTKTNSPGARAQAIEQFNVLYVALTRAMQKLVDPTPKLYPPDIPDPIQAAHDAQMEKREAYAAMMAQAGA